MQKTLILVVSTALLVLGRQESAEAAPDKQLRAWPDYRTIMWVGDSAYKQPDKVALFFQRLRDMGINTAMVYGDGDLKPLLDNHFPYYVENLVNKGLCLKWNSKVLDWDRFVTTWTKTGRPAAAFVRDYCLDDPEWRTWARQQVQQLARKNAPHQPLAYDLRDELSTTMSANPFDYDFNPMALARFRDWLKLQYGDLTRLNAQWETAFTSWNEVKPFSTDQIKNRMSSGEALPRGNPDWQAVQRLKFDPVEARRQPTRWNFSPWCDFRTYMDISLATTLDDLRQAARATDPQTPVGIEGTQMPHAFGGYDLWRLAQALDWMEPYDIGNAREILGSFMPGQPLLCTLFEKETNPASRRLWHLLLEGDRGCIVWWSEDCLDWKSPDYALTTKARALAPVLKEMTSPLAQLFLRARKEYDPFFIHYSQPSIQVDWLLESTVDGSTWHRRFSSYEADHNRMARVRNGWLKAFQDLGLSPRFISSSQLEAGLGVGDAAAALVLPQSYALSDREAEAIRSFLSPASASKSTRRIVLADGTAGLFDAHGRLRPASPLENLFPAALSQDVAYAAGQGGPAPGPPALRRAGDISKLGTERLQQPPKTEWQRWIQDQGWTGPVKLPVEACTRIHRFQLGAARLLAFERNINYQMSEDLKQAGGNESLEKPVDLEAELPEAAHVHDLRTGRYLGHLKRIAFHLDSWRPSLFALLPEPQTDGRIVEALLAGAAAGTTR